METSRITERCWTLTFRRGFGPESNFGAVSLASLCALLSHHRVFLLVLRYYGHRGLCEQHQAAGEQSTCRPAGRAEPLRTCWMANRRRLQVPGRWKTDRPVIQPWLDHPVVLMFFPVWLSIYGGCMRMSCLILGGVMSCFVVSESWIHWTLLATSNGTLGRCKTIQILTRYDLWMIPIDRTTRPFIFCCGWSTHWGWIQGPSIVNARCMRRVTPGFRRAPLISGAPPSNSRWMEISSPCCIRSSSPGVAGARGWLPPAVKLSTRRNGVGQNMWHLPGPFSQRELAVLSMASKWDRACPWSPSCWAKCCPCWASEEIEAFRGHSFGIPSTTSPLSWTFAWCFSWSTAGRESERVVPNG